MANFNENFEEKIINTVPAAAKEIESKMHSDLVNMANGRVFNDMRAHKVANNNTPSPTSAASPATESKAKTLVREKNNAPRVINNTVPVQQPTQTTSDKYRYVTSEESTTVGGQNNPFDSLRSGGNATASTILIVIASFVIIAMLIVICLTVLNSLGMLPF